MIELLINDDQKSIRDFIIGHLKTAKSLNCAIAYFADSDIVDTCLNSKIKVRLLVSLTPPTNPFILKKLLPHPTTKIEIKFLTKSFHSKLTVFSRSNGSTAAIIGSSNYTNGGLQNNIETNIFIENEKELKNIVTHFDNIWQNSPSLSPDDLTSYIPLYQKAMKHKKKIDENINSFQKNKLAPRIKNSKTYIRKEGLIYYEFWKCIDDVRDLVLAESKVA